MKISEHLIIGLQGPSLTESERHWLHHHPPLGVILFTRNIETPGQVKALLADVRDCTGQNTWAAIDEEGGRINRIPWPPFSDRKAAAEYGHLYEQDEKTALKAVHDDGKRAGQALKELGFTHNCAPVLDVFCEQGDAIIGNRAFSRDPEAVASLGSAHLQGLHAAGIEAVGKHFPGHGRADADSHLAVPEVDAPLAVLLAEAEPFLHAIERGLKHVMTAHVIYSKAEARIATLSSFWLQGVLRERFGHTGRIWSDDLCMQGAGNDLRAAAEQALKAGCDTLLVCEPQRVRDLLA